MKSSKINMINFIIFPQAIGVAFSCKVSDTNNSFLEVVHF